MRRPTRVPPSGRKRTKQRQQAGVRRPTRVPPRKKKTTKSLNLASQIKKVPSLTMSKILGLMKKKPTSLLKYCTN